jgi:multidrug efflux pump subunit AcrA (membrane-fusion protein)
MRIVVPLIAAMALAGPLSAQSLQPLPPGAEAQQARLLAHIGPQARAFILREARLEAAGGAPTEARARGAAEANRAMLGARSSADIDALVFLILMQVNQDAEASLRQQMADMQQVQQQKAALRQQQAAMANAQAAARAAAEREYAALRASGKIAPSVTFDQFVANSQPPGPPVAPRFSAVAVSPKKDNPDSLGEMSEIDQMRLQSLMDQRSKMMEALSNLMKKASDTRATITDNLK